MAAPLDLSALGTSAGDGTASALGWKATTGPARAVRLNTDTEFGGSWVRINAERPADLVALRRAVAMAVPVLAPEAIRPRARAPASWPGSLVMLALASARPPQDEDLAILNVALTAREPAVRVAAATGALLSHEGRLIADAVEDAAGPSGMGW